MRNIISFTEQVVRKGESPRPKMYRVLKVGDMQKKKLLKSLEENLGCIVEVV